MTAGKPALAAPEHALDEVDLLLWGRRLHRRRWLAAAIILVCTLSAAARSRLRPAEFTATVQLLAASGPPGYTATGPEAAPGVVSDLWSSARARSNLTHAEALRGPQVLELALEKLPERYRSPFLSYLKAGNELPVKVAAPLNTDIITLEVSTESRAASLAFANAIAEVYANFTRRLGVDLARQGAEALRPELQRAITSMTRAEEALLARQRKSGIYNPDASLEATTDRLGELQTLLGEARVSLASTQHELAAVEAERKAIAPRIVSMTRDRRTEKVDAVQKGVADPKLEQAEPAEVSRPEAARTRSLASEPQAAQQDLPGLPETVFFEEQRSMNPTWLEVDKRFMELTAEEKSLQATVKALQTEYDAQTGLLQELSREEAVQQRLTSQVEGSRDNYASIIRQLDTLRAGALARLPTVMPLGPADAPLQGARKVPQAAISGLLVGVLLAVAVIGVLEARAAGSGACSTGSAAPR